MMPRIRIVVVFGLLVAGAAMRADAQGKGLAPTPPMGWNSWDSYGTTVREHQVKANADVMARDLARFGWSYIVVDIQWYQPNAEGHDYKPGATLTMDGFGRLTPAVNKFPSALPGGGFTSLAAYVHGKGLKFGMHLMRGIPRQAVDQNLPIKGTRYHAADTWPDADMLPLGRLRLTDKEGKGSPAKFTADEQRTMMTLWSVFRSPLIFGGDLPSNDSATTALITNDEVIAVNQRSVRAREVIDRDSVRVPMLAPHASVLYRLSPR